MEIELLEQRQEISPTVVIQLRGLYLISHQMLSLLLVQSQQQIARRSREPPSGSGEQMLSDVWVFRRIVIQSLALSSQSHESLAIFRFRLVHFLSEVLEELTQDPSSDDLDVSIDIQIQAKVSRSLFADKMRSRKGDECERVSP
jgi:hypothetical protein